MEFVLNVGVILQGGILAGIVWQVRSINELTTAVKMQDYRIGQLEEKVKACPSH